MDTTRNCQQVQFLKLLAQRINFVVRGAWMVKPTVGKKDTLAGKFLNESKSG
jgi:hypothetical protein